MKFVRLIGSTTLLLAALASRAEAVDFAQDVEPILRRSCYACHGPDKQRSSFRLDQREAALAGGDFGKAIEPGQADASPLIEYVSNPRATVTMPPSGQRLSAEEVRVLREWINAGANYPASNTASDKNAASWWSLKPLVRPAVPSLSAADQAQVRTPIDAFILARLRQEQLPIAPEADRRTLIRRLTFDLIGLPPTFAEVESFVASADPSAYEKLVEQLLASPHYGERWARHWLDVVHFGETHGYDKDKPRPHAWPYRDYVIRAFNNDKPYDRFILEQLAGDVLFPLSPDGIEALGFIAAGPWDLIGHAEVSEAKKDGKIARHLDRDDMVSNTIGTFNSLTVQCAQCHNHKFDPITQDDYYRLQAVFAAVDRADKAYYQDPKQTAEYAALTQRQRDATRRKQALDSEVTRLGGAELAAIDKQLAPSKAPPSAVPPEYGYHSQLAPDAERTKWVQVDLQQPQSLRRVTIIGCFDTFNNIGAGFGFPERFRIEAADDERFTQNVRVLVDRSAVDYRNPGTAPQTFEFAATTARFVRVTALRLALRQNDYMFALAELAVLNEQGENLALRKPVTALDSIEAGVRWRKTNLVDGLYSGAARNPVRATPSELEQQRRSIIEQHVPEATRFELAAVTESLKQINEQLAKMPPPQRIYAGIVHHGQGNFAGTGHQQGKPRSIHVLRRGDVDRPFGPECPPGAISAVSHQRGVFQLPSDHHEGDRRAALARWLADDRNPLTWRSIVNRVWLYHFGRAIVDTPNDFGRMGELPSHPELLDYLACELRDGGKSLKQLHRLIVTSRVYRQSSHVDPAVLKRDANNVWLSHYSRRRLEAEGVRDAVLAVSGQLDRTLFGPSFQDFVIEQPAHSPHYEYGKADPNDPKTFRRSVYRFLVRSQPQPFMTTLDCADPSMRVDKRTESLSALQALAMLNEGFMVTMARHFATRIEQQGGSRAEQVRRAWRDALGHEPTAEQAASLSQFAQQHGLANACRLILNLNEFVFVD